jgi:hypothetical protein
MTAAAACFVVLAVLHVFTPLWWWVMAVPFLFGLAYGRSAWRSAGTGALAAGSLWLAAAAYSHLAGGALIAGRMSSMMGLGSSWLMVAAAGLVAALAAGVSGLAGYAVRALFRRGG